MKFIPLIQVCDFQGGSQPPKEQWIDHEKEGYIRMLQIRDFTQPDKNNVEYVRISKAIKTCNEDDILIGRYGASVGKILSGLAGAYNVAIIKTIPDTSKLSKRFLYHYLNSPYFQNFILSVGSRAAQAGFNKDDLSDAQIPVLSLEAQSNVVSQLDKVSELIALRKEQLAALDQLVKSRFIELFGDAKDEDKLINLCGFIDYRGKTPEKVESGLPFITAKNVKMHHMSFDTQEFISKETYDKVMTRGFPRIGDVVFTTEAPLGNVCRIPYIETEFYIGQRIITIQTEQLEPAYLEYALSSDDFKRKIAEKSSGSTVTGIRSKLLEQLTIPVPPRAVQKQFATFVEQTDKSKLAIQRSLDELETLKKALMQKYFG